ncbi:hypothetical protein KKI24_03455 [bacterium]|nr:hypothetical protein [bacterium]
MEQELKIHSNVKKVWETTKVMVRSISIEPQWDEIERLTKDLKRLKLGLARHVDTPEFQTEKAVYIVCMGIRGKLIRRARGSIEDILIPSDKQILKKSDTLSNLFTKQIRAEKKKNIKVLFPKSLEIPENRVNAIKTFEIEVNNDQADGIIDIKIARAYVNNTLMSNAVLKVNDRPEKIEEIFNLIDTLTGKNSFFYEIGEGQDKRTLFNQQLSEHINTILEQTLPAEGRNKNEVLKSAYEWLAMAKSRAYQVSLQYQEAFLQTSFAARPWDIDGMINMIKESRSNQYHHPEIEPLIASLRENQILYSKLYYSLNYIRKLVSDEGKDLRADKTASVPERFHIDPAAGAKPGARTDLVGWNFLMSDIIVAGKYESDMLDAISAAKTTDETDESIKVIHRILSQLLISIKGKMKLFADELENKRDKLVFVRSINYQKQFRDDNGDAEKRTQYTALIEESAASSELIYLTVDSNRKNVLENLHKNDVKAMSAYIETIVRLVEAELGMTLSKMSDEKKGKVAIAVKSIRINDEKPFPNRFSVIRNYLSNYSTLFAIQKKGLPQGDTTINLLVLERIYLSFLKKFAMTSGDQAKESVGS